MKSYKPAARWMVVCASFVGGFEGLACTAYPDRLAHGLPTVCYGETEGVKLGDHYTPDECKQMLAGKLPRYWSEIEPCIHVPVSDNEKIAYTSFVYNVGPGAVCNKRSSINRDLNKGDHVGACNALLLYDHASGVEVPGLARRRRAERELCLTPDNTPSTRTTLDLTKEAPVVLPAEPRVSFWTHLWRWLVAKVHSL